MQPDAKWRGLKPRAMTQRREVMTQTGGVMTQAGCLASSRDTGFFLPMTPMTQMTLVTQIPGNSRQPGMIHDYHPGSACQKAGVARGAPQIAP
jgi:hypothetical protein